MRNWISCTAIYGLVQGNAGIPEEMEEEPKLFRLWGQQEYGEDKSCKGIISNEFVNLFLN